MEGRSKDYSARRKVRGRAGIIRTLAVLVLVIGVAGFSLTDEKARKAQKTNSEDLKTENRGCGNMELNPLRMDEYPEITSCLLYTSLFLDHVQGSIHAGEDFKVFQFGGAVLQVGREVRKPFLGRNLGDFYRKASYGILLFQQRNIASDLRRGAGGFQSGGSCAYDDYAARLFDGCLLIGFSIDEIRIDGASKGLVASDTVDVYKRQCLLSSRQKKWTR